MNYALKTHTNANMAQSTLEFHRPVKIQHRAVTAKRGTLNQNYVYTQLKCYSHFIQCFNQDQSSFLKMCKCSQKS